MNEFASLLQPPDVCIPRLKMGELAINTAANRVFDVRTGQFTHRLVPTSAAAELMSQLPQDATAAQAAIMQSVDFAPIKPVLEGIKLASNVAAIASVANIGISCVGFALVLHKLKRIEGRLDEMMGRIGALQEAVQTLQNHVEALSMSRIHAAKDSLERALHAQGESARLELAARSRNLFQEGRQLYLELWRRADPMLQPDVHVATALEIQARYTACAVGEIQAEFVRGDLGAFRHACQCAARDIRETMTFDGEEAFARRSDAVCTREPHGIPRFLAEGQRLQDEITLSWKMVQVNEARLAGYAEDADLVEALGMEPHQLVHETQALQGTQIFFLPQMKSG